MPISRMVTVCKFAISPKAYSPISSIVLGNSTLAGLCDHRKNAWSPIVLSVFGRISALIALPEAISRVQWLNMNRGTANHSRKGHM